MTYNQKVNITFLTASWFIIAGVSMLGVSVLIATVGNNLEDYIQVYIIGPLIAAVGICCVCIGLLLLRSGIKLISNPANRYRIH